MLREYYNYALNLCLGHSLYLNNKIMLKFNIIFASGDTVAGSTLSKEEECKKSFWERLFKK